MAVVAPTDLPKSVRIRFEIEVLGGVFVLSLCVFGFSVGIRAFVTELGQFSSLFPSYQSN